MLAVLTENVTVLQSSHTTGAQPTVGTSEYVSTSASKITKKLVPSHPLPHCGPQPDQPSAALVTDTTYSNCTL